jgi:hypothetical protein
MKMCTQYAHKYKMKVLIPWKTLDSTLRLNFCDESWKTPAAPTKFWGLVSHSVWHLKERGSVSLQAASQISAGLMLLTEQLPVTSFQRQPPPLSPPA